MARNIYVKGVGGKINVKGYGTIKIQVVDDDNDLCDLVILNVLYVPECPMNLLSPQLWLECTDKPERIGEVTIGGMTVMFWDGKKFTKLVPHHPELKMPIFTTEDGNNLEMTIA